VPARELLERKRPTYPRSDRERRGIADQVEDPDARGDGGERKQPSARNPRNPREPPRRSALPNGAGAAAAGGGDRLHHAELTPHKRAWNAFSKPESRLYHRARTRLETGRRPCIASGDRHARSASAHARGCFSSRW